MDWTEMSKYQRTAARKLLDNLREQNVSTSVSQVAKYFDETMAWDRGEISLAELCQQTGWDLPASAAPAPGEELATVIGQTIAATVRPDEGTVERIAHVAADIAVLNAALATLKPQLLDAITAADQADGERVREDLVRAASPGLSRRLVVQHLGAQDVLTLAEEAVKESGIRKDSHYSIALKPKPDGAVALYFDTNYPWTEGPDDEPDPHEAKQQERSRYIGEHNALSALLMNLKDKGLSYSTDGPHETVIDDLRAMEPALIRIKRR